MRLRSRNVNENEREDENPQVQANPVNHQNQANDFDSFYYNLQQPGAYSRKLLRYLRKNENYSLHRPKRKNFPRRRIVTHFPGHIVQSDLIDMQKLATKNSYYKFILVVIDCFSKKLWTRALKSKSGEETAKALRSILESMKYPVQTMIFDEGLEYVNKYVSELLAEYNIHSYHIKSRLKASSAERVNRTIKEKLWKYFTKTGRERWVDILEDITENYNKTYHRTIKMAPDEVNWDNRETVFKTSFPKIKEKISCRLKVGDKVRVALRKDVFEKGYTQNWSKDVFEITNVFQKNGVCWYRIKGEDGKIYPKSKYFYELNKI